MLAIIFSWITIFFIFVSAGDFFIGLYNKIGKRKEVYNVTDSFLLGMCLVTIFLSITSLWLPSGKLMFFLYLILSCAYWLIFPHRRKEVIMSVKNKIKGLTRLQLLFFLVPVFGFIVMCLWSPGVFDSSFYHQQFVRWNEEYAVVPGLANLEDRFGFNSNFLLVSAPFTFRFLFDEAVYTLSPLILVCVMCWVINEIIKSGYKVSRILLLAVFFLFFFMYTYMLLTTTSTDTVPSFIIFYLACYFVMYPDQLSKKTLLVALLPVLQVTFKLSVVPIGLLSLYILFVLFKNNKRQLVFVVGAMFLISVPWLIRNVIISGYLVYPLYQLDFFSFDWKLPSYVAMQQNAFIEGCAIGVFKKLYLDFGNWAVHSLMARLMLLFVILSPLVVIYSAAKKKYNPLIYLIYTSLFLLFLFWLLKAPDPRFIIGILLALIFITLYMLFPIWDKKTVSRGGVVALSCWGLIMLAWAGKRSVNYYNQLHLADPVAGAKKLKEVLYTPYSFKDQMIARGYNHNLYTEYPLNNGITVYLGENDFEGLLYVYDKLPSTVEETIWTSKFQSIESIEARGYSLQDGFRPKKLE